MATKKTDQTVEQEADNVLATGNDESRPASRTQMDRDVAIDTAVAQESADQFEPEPGQPDSFAAGAPAGVSQEDLLWWNNSQNRNYMAGDGPQAGITEGSGGAQSASSVDPEIRAKTLEEAAARVAEEDAAFRERQDQALRDFNASQASTPR